ncbi:hypothetical protein Cgig2_024676 [Carnegiea gigantea]|uniref:Uncharacterized protein n=1 Tax=Carnegiea gigantea TaxID=171969 RepID=A0A9Q1K929_9CARY|nr:hypothetical protein Cgig2_024676 [Carnegiea gigantea]
MGTLIKGSLLHNPQVHIWGAALVSILSLSENQQPQIDETQIDPLFLDLIWILNPPPKGFCRGHWLKSVEGATNSNHVQIRTPEIGILGRLPKKPSKSADARDSLSSNVLTGSRSNDSTAHKSGNGKDVPHLGWAVGGEGNVRAPKGEILGRDQLWAGAIYVTMGPEDFMGQLGRGLELGPT